MEFHLDRFEGPLDLLLALVRQREVDIDALSLLSITEQYLAAISDFDMEDVAEFVYVASVLVEMKAKYLNKGDLGDLELSENDPMNALVQRLRRYKQFKEASVFFESRLGALDGHFFREPSDIPLSSDEIETLSLDKRLLFEALRRVMLNLQRFDDERQTYFENIRRDRYTVSDRIRSIRRILRLSEQIVFSQLFDEETTKSEMIVTFLALLELLKAGTIRVAQETAFGEITIRRGNAPHA